MTMYRMRAPLSKLLCVGVRGDGDGVGVVKVIVLLAGTVTLTEEFSLSPMDDIVLLRSV